MAAGRIRIYRRQNSTEAGRRVEKEPKLFYSCWCEVSDLYGNELYKALDIRLENTAVFEVRYCKKVKEIKKRAKEFFVEYEGDRYDIYATDFRANDKQKVILKTNRTE